MSRLVRLFWETTLVSGESMFTPRAAEKYERARILVNLYYFLLFYVALQSVSPFSVIANWQQMDGAEAMFVPLWSASWMRYLPWKVAVKGVLLFFMSTSFVAIWAGIRYRWVRLAAFLGLFFYLSLVSSFGKIDHYLHVFTVVAFLFVFLPNHHARPTTVRSVPFLQLFWGCQLWLLATYTSSGTFKLLGIGSQLLSGEIHAFHPESLARNVAKGNLNFGYRMFFDTWLVDSPSWLFSLLLVGGYLVEFLAIFVAFYPSLHRLWGVLLIGLHASVLLTVGPDFSLQVLMVGVLLIFSPFASSGEARQSWPALALRTRKPSTGAITAFCEPDDFSHRRRLAPSHQNARPGDIRVVSQASPEFAAFLRQYPALSEVRTLVVTESTNDRPIIRIKSEGLLWLLSHSSAHPWFYRLLLLIPPVITNLVYDWNARHRRPTGTLAAAAPAPPEATA